jgi:hypothetical protein
MALPLTAVPAQHTSGDTFDVVITLTDQPAPTYAAVIYLTGFGLQPITVNSVAYGVDHRFLLSGGSVSWPAGVYNWVLRTDGAGVVQTVQTGVITIKANPATITATTDTRTHARRTLDLIQAAIEGRVPDGVDSYSVDGRSITSIPLRELFALRDKYAAIVASEEAKAAGKSGLRVHKTAFRRF